MTNEGQAPTNAENQNAQRLDVLEETLAQMMKPVAAPDACNSESGSAVIDASSDLTLMLERCIREFNEFSVKYDASNAEDTFHSQSTKNPILRELQQYGRTHGFLNECFQYKPNQAPLIDCLEIYCSAESQLTNRCRQHGLRAIRFGLKEGDLGTWEGRQRLYHVLFSCRPRNVWMSPKCKAWCKWSQFNATRSMECAQRVIESRKADEPHLQLCEAVFMHQCQMGVLYHFHLEQPIGSDMLYEEPLHHVLEHVHRVRCDLCHAGNLRHPNSGHFLQKGTQILTTSSIMARYIENSPLPT